jgi:cobalt-zinc-cadmium efflux system outer membrane protein
MQCIIKGIFLVTTALTGFVASAYSQGNAPAMLSMHTALVEAMENNASLKSLRFEQSAAEADRITAGLRPNPSLTVNADILPSEGFTAKDKNYGVSLGIPIELGGKRDARMKQADAALRVTELQYQDALRQTTLAVRSAYIDFASTAERAGAYGENLALLDSLVSLSKIRVRDKDIAPVELTRSEVERARFQLETLRSIEEHRAARTTLYALMGRRGSRTIESATPDTAAFTTIRSIATRPLPQLDSMLILAEQQRSDVRVLRATEEEAIATSELQHSLATIDVNVSLDYLRSQEITYYGTTISVPLPIFNRNQGEIEKADVREREAKAQTDAALLLLRADVTNAWYDAKNKQMALRTLGESVLGKSLDVRSAIEYAYRRGGTSLIDFLDAARTYNELRQSYVEALSDFGKSLVVLNAVVGADVFNEFQ